MAVNKLVVLIPAFNEEKSIGAVIKAIPREIAGVGRVEVLVLDDGSIDRTPEEARKAGADKIVSHGWNMGLGRAFQDGVWGALKMKAGIIVNIDADGQFNPKDIPRLIEPLLEGKADVAICTRFGQRAFEPKMPWVKKLGNRLFTSLVNALTKSRFTDTQCGFRAYSKEAALRMNLFGKFTYTQEVLMDLMQKGMRIVEVPCRVVGERKGKSRVVKHWYSYGMKALIIIIRAIRDYKPLRFFGSIGLLLLFAGGISALALWLRLLLYHVITPFMWVVYADVVLIILGFLLVVLALLADMSDRQRKIQEEILYRLKKQEIENS
jgi:glycosyltransferase involved in cell wall biosynthesis